LAARKHPLFPESYVQECRQSTGYAAAGTTERATGRGDSVDLQFGLVVVIN